MGLFEDVYKIVERIPKGKVMTYGQIARLLGYKDVRKIGYALHSNRTPESVPCHRVVFADGSLAPGYAFGGPAEQKKKLVSEGVKFTGEKVDMEREC